MKKREQTKNSPRIRIGPVAQVLLGTIAGAGIITIAVCAPNALQLLKPFFKNKKYSSKQVINRNIESLVLTGLVKKTISIDGEVVLELTRRGVWESAIHSVNTYPKKPVWDGKWRVVIFDVPNTQSKLRGELTRGMRMYGFKLLQKSVWIYPYQCDDFVKMLRTHLELKDSVLHMTVSSMEDEKKWKKSFKL